MSMMVPAATTIDPRSGRTTSRTLEQQKLLDGCQQFEAMLLGQMLTKMRESVPDDGLLPRGMGEKIFQEMLDTEYAQQMSRNNATGLAAMLYRELSSNLSAEPQK